MHCSAVCDASLVDMRGIFLDRAKRVRAGDHVDVGDSSALLEQHGDGLLREGDVAGLCIGLGGQARPALARRDILRVGAFVVRGPVLVPNFGRGNAEAAELQPRVRKVLAAKQRHQLEHHFAAALNGGEVVVRGHQGVRLRIGDGGELAGGGIEADGGGERFGVGFGLAGFESVGHGQNGIDAGGDQVVPMLVAGALPHGHPVAGEGEPVRTDAEADGRLAGQFGLGLAHGVEVGDGQWSVFGGLVDDVAGALVGGEVVEGAPVRGLADARFLCAVAPLDDVVARAESAHGAEVVGVGLAGVARVRFSQAEEVSAAAAQVAVPEPERRAELGVIPRMAAPVVVPHVARRGVGVDEVAVLPEAVPGAVVDLALIEGEHRVEAVLDGFLEGGGAVGQTPHAEDAGGMDVLRRGGEQRKLTRRRRPWRRYPAWQGRRQRRRG